MIVILASHWVAKNLKDLWITVSKMKLTVYKEIRGNGLEAVETRRRRWLLQVCAFALRAFEVEISKASRDICPYLVCVDLQLRTSKVDNFIIGSGNFFGIKLSAGMDSEGQITSKTGVV